MSFSDFDEQMMQRALELAARGEGRVEPNPMVGCVIAADGEIVGEGWHQEFGGPHAEIEALRAAGERARGAAMYVTLEPCCHYGKTPPCSEAVIAAGLARVVVAQQDPFAEVNGGGIAQLKNSGIIVETGLLCDQAAALNAPYRKLIETGRPWVIAKWAMSLDGKIASRSGDSKWISCEASRAVVHAIRGRVDAIVVGRGTAAADDPLLTARPPGPRTATRIVLDSSASLASSSQFVRTARDAPVLVAASSTADETDVARLREAGCEVLLCEGATRRERLDQLFAELGARRMTNVLVEGGAELLGELFDAQLVDELHVFIAPKIIGGKEAPSPIGGSGIEQVGQFAALRQMQVEQVGDDVYLRARLKT